MNKKVLYISYDGMTDQLGQSQVLPYLVKLSTMGYEFTLLSFEKKDKFQKLSATIRAICEKNNIRWVPEFFSSRPPLLSKVYDGWKMKRTAARLHRQHEFAFTHCRSYVAAAAGLKLQEKYGLPFLFDMRGFWVDERVDNNQWSLNNPVYKFAYKHYKKKEKKYFHESSRIISLTEKGKEELVTNYGIAAEKIFVIPCCADLDHFDYNRINEADKEALRVKLGISKQDKVISYLGSLGGWYLTDEMLVFFSVLKSKQPEAKFLFITQDSKESILAKAGARGISAENIIVAPGARQDVPLLLSLSDKSLFFIKDAYSKKASSPTKQGEIMAMGIPIICNDIGDTGKIVSESNAGVVVKSFTPEGYNEIVDNLNSLNNLKKEAIRQSAFKYYDLKTGTETYARVYKEVAP